MDQKIIEFVSFIAVNSVVVERSVEFVKKCLPVNKYALLFVEEENKKRVYFLLAMFYSIFYVWVNVDVITIPIFLNKGFALCVAVAGSSCGSSMWNDILSIISKNKLTTK